MRVVTIAVGEYFRRQADLLVASVRKHLGLETTVVTHTYGVQPAKYKLRLLYDFLPETILYLDADARVLRPWDTARFDEHPYPVVCLDWPSRARDADCEAYAIDPDRYFASGFWIANHRHRTVWDAAFDIATAHTYSTRFKYEQTALNVAAQMGRLPLTILDRRYCWIPTVKHPPPPDCLQIAFGGDSPRDRALYDAAVRAAETP